LEKHLLGITFAKFGVKMNFYYVCYKNGHCRKIWPTFLCFLTITAVRIIRLIRQTRLHHTTVKVSNLHILKHAFPGLKTKNLNFVTLTAVQIFRLIRQIWHHHAMYGLKHTFSQAHIPGFKNRKNLSPISCVKKSYFLPFCGRFNWLKFYFSSSRPCTRNLAFNA
jgi:hypothetical protein